MNAAPLPLRVLRWFWVPLSSEAEAMPEASRARARAARASLLLGEHVLARGEVGGEALDPAASLVAALGCFRSALALGITDARGVADPASYLDAVAVDAAERIRLRRLLCEVPLAELADRPEGTLLDEVTRAGEFAREALSPLLAREATRRERLRARFTRLTLLLASLVVAAAVGPGLRRALKPELATTARWRASSTMGPLPQSGVGFHPREGEGNFFFQTQIEAEPWVEFDLGADRRIESVTVQNRLDCCQDWAVPMVVEIAGATRQWREVGRRVEPFYFYTANFSAVPARYVRVRVPRTTSLHLGSMKIR